ncbi:MAG: phosphoribosyltransferase family protein [bacterium]|nr:phosphoribosyltransferase family protein [bacterium]
MEKNKLTLIKKLKKLEVLTKGTFVLHSGKVSDYYLDIKKAYSDPKVLSLMAKMIASKIPKKVTCVAATGHGGIPLATAISIIKSIPLILVRQTARDHGTMSAIDGYIPNSNDIVAIIDDVYSTGSSINQITNALSQYNLKIAGAFVIVSRVSGKTPSNVNNLLSIRDFV